MDILTYSLLFTFIIGLFHFFCSWSSFWYLTVSRRLSFWEYVTCRLQYRRLEYNVYICHIVSLRQYFSLYRTVSQRERKKTDMIDKVKNVQLPPPAPTASTVGPCPTTVQPVLVATSIKQATCVRQAFVQIQNGQTRCNVPVLSKHLS